MQKRLHLLDIKCCIAAEFSYGMMTRVVIRKYVLMNDRTVLIGCLVIYMRGNFGFKLVIVK